MLFSFDVRRIIKNLKSTLLPSNLNQYWLRTPLTTSFVILFVLLPQLRRPMPIVLLPPFTQSVPPMRIAGRTCTYALTASFLTVEFEASAAISIVEAFDSNDSMSYTHSLGLIPQSGMYNLVVAGTVGLYNNYTAGTPISFSFSHTDRMGTYIMSNVNTTPVVSPSFDLAYSFFGDYVFQALSGSSIAYYYYSPGVSTTNCTASIMTTATLTQMLSASVTGSV